ncbi:hypothetical protein ACLOJK_001316 [Asimina triloba]
MEIEKDEAVDDGGMVDKYSFDSVKIVKDRVCDLKGEDGGRTRSGEDRIAGGGVMVARNQEASDAKLPNEKEP